MMFNHRARKCKNKSVKAITAVETRIASTKSKITKHARKKSPARGEEKAKKSKTKSVKAITGVETSITSTKFKITKNPHEKSPARGGKTSDETSEKITLRNCDVLFGRGNGIASWKGNKNFRGVVNSYKATYTNAHRQEKSSVSRQVIEDIHEGGGRFIETNSYGDHVEVPYIKALEKTCQCLREKSGDATGDSEDDVIVLPEKCSKMNRAVEEEIPELLTSSTSPVQRKGACSLSRRTKKARTEKATKVLPSMTASEMNLKKPIKKETVTASQMTLKKPIKKEPVTASKTTLKQPKEKEPVTASKMTLKPAFKMILKKPNKKEPRVPRKAVKQSTSKDVAARAAKIGPTSSVITTTIAKSTTESEPECRVQKLIDQAVENKASMHPDDLEDMLIFAPPNLTPFFSGIVSLSEMSIHAVIGKGHPGADFTVTPASPPTRGKTLATLKQARERNPAESPTNVTDFDMVMLEAVFEPAFEPSQSADFTLDLLEDSAPRHWSVHGYMG
jgi:hypothetical protein